MFQDISGEVVAVGSSVTAFKPGDKVIGYSHSFLTGNNDHAGFQTYTITLELATTKLPEGVSYEDGTSLIRMGSASSVFFITLGFPMPTSIKPTEERPTSILVWGGSAANGTMLIQLARIMGFTVFATASKVNHDYLKTLGATEVFDYHSATVVDDLVDAAKKVGKPITVGIDVNSEKESLKATAEVLTKSGGKGSKLAHYLGWPEDLSKPEDLTLLAVGGPQILTSRKDVAAWLYGGFLVKAVEGGALVPSPKVQVVEGGISALQTGLDLLKEGVSATRLVVKVD